MACERPPAASRLSPFVRGTRSRAVSMGQSPPCEGGEPRSGRGSITRYETCMPTEVWLRGPLPDIPQLLQPIAHALLQACEDVDSLTRDFPAEKLWQQPGGAASAG